MDKKTLDMFIDRIDELEVVTSYENNDPESIFHDYYTIIGKELTGKVLLINHIPSLIEPDLFDVELKIEKEEGSEVIFDTIKIKHGDEVLYIITLERPEHSGTNKLSYTINIKLYV